MKLSVLYEATGPRSGKVVGFNYAPSSTKPSKGIHDPKPMVFVLGRMEHPTTGNILLCGINLNYLSEEEIQHIVLNLDAIMGPRTTKDRYWAGREIAPNAFTNAYRTYNQDFVTEVSRKQLESIFGAKPDVGDRPEESGEGEEPPTPKEVV